MSRNCRHLYGPVPSRRLGRSLGIDAIPFKTCSFDCVYCQLGRTTRHVMERAPYVSCLDVLEEAAELLALDRPDVVSFAGSGEPTLNSELGCMIHGIKKLTDAPVAVFTNASLLWMPDVREDLAQADIVSPSLDAAVPSTAQRVNRLCEGLSWDMVYEGLKTFARTYRGRIWLEILLVQGVNDGEADLDALREACRGLSGIERIQFNTVSRPPADRGVRPLSRERLEAIASSFPGRTEIIASFPRVQRQGQGQTAGRRRPGLQDAADLVGRHPSTARGLALGLGIAEKDAEALLAQLEQGGTVLAEKRQDGVYYRLASQVQKPQRSECRGMKIPGMPKR